MESDPGEADFAMLGDYSPGDGRRLLAALASSHIEFRAQFDDGIRTGALGPNFGAYARVRIFVDRKRLAQADEIQNTLFGE